MNCVQTSFNIFDKPPVDGSVENFEDVQILPLSGVTNDAVIDLVVPEQISQYIDLSKTLLYVKVRISRIDKAAIPASKISLISLWPSSLFRQLDLYLGSSLVSTSTNQSAYRSFLETFLSYSKSVKNDQLKVLEHFEGSEIPASENGSYTLEALTKLSLDMFQQNKFLLNGVKLSLRLYRNNDAFIFLMKDDINPKDYSLTIDDISLFVRHITPTSTILLDHARLLAQQTAFYPIDRSIVKTYHVSKGMTDEAFSNIFMGQIPQRIIIGLVKTSDYNGDYKTNPFTFSHFNLTHISLDINGRQYPSRPLEPNFETGQFARSYHSLLETVLGECLDERSLGLSYDDYFTKGKTLFGFSLIPNYTTALTPRMNGNINLNLKFRTPLKENVTVIVYSELQNVIQIDAARNIHTDYGF